MRQLMVELGAFFAGLHHLVFLNTDHARAVDQVRMSISMRCRCRRCGAGKIRTPPCTAELHESTR